MKKKLSVRTQSLNITERAVMISIDFRKLGNTRRLPNSQFTVAADAKMVRASKKLLDSAELKAVGTFDGQVREYIASRALPSLFKSGFWMLPVPLVEEVDAQLEQFAKERAKLVEDFVFAYPNLIKMAAALLNKIYNPADYMTAEGVRAQFSLSWRYVTFGVPDQLEAIKKQVYDREKKKAAEHWAEATREMQNLLRSNMADLVAHMVDRLTPGKDGKAKSFHSTMVEKVLDFLQTFDSRNITDDEQLKALVVRARKLVEGVDHAKLKKDADLRANMQKGFQQIKDTLDKLVVVKAKRKLKLTDDPGDAQQPALKLDGDAKKKK